MCSNIQTVHSIELKFDMNIIGRRSICCINFNEFQWFTGIQKKFFYITAYGVKLSEVY